MEELSERAATTAESDPIVNDRLRRLVGSLPDKARLMVVLRYQEDLDPEDIAQVMNIPVNTVKSQLHRALAMLRQKAERMNWEK